MRGKLRLLKDPPVSEPGTSNDQEAHHPHASGSWGVVLIGVGKLTTGVLLAAAGFGIFHYLNRDLHEVVQRFLTLVRLDPDSRIFHTIVSGVSGIDRKQLRELGIGTFFYSLLHLVEGSVLRQRCEDLDGLLLGRHT